MKTVIFTSDNEHRLKLLVQLAKEMGVDVVQHYENAGDTHADAVSEADERYTTKVLVDVSEEKRGKNGDYHLPGPPPSAEDLEAWLDPNNDGDEEFTSEEMLAYVRKELEKNKKK